MSFEIKIYNSFEDSLETIWNNFEKEAESYCFQNSYWLKNWYQSLNNKNDIDLHIFLVYQNQKLLFIFPLCIEKKYGLKILKWQGGNQSDYMGGLIKGESSLEKKEFLLLWKKIKDKLPDFDITYFKNQPEKIGNAINPFVNHLNSFKTSNSRSINLKDSFETFINNNLKKKFLSDTKRSLNTLNKKGRIDFKIYENVNNSQRKKIIEEILYQKELRLKELNQKNEIDKFSENFYINFDERKFLNGNLHISSLKFNDTIIAMHWGAIYKNTYYYLMPSIAKTEYLKYSPGRLLLYKLVEWCYQKNIKKFDLSLGEESYKKNWSNLKNGLYDLYETNSLKSYPLFYLLKIRSYLKSL